MDRINTAILTSICSTQAGIARTTLAFPRVTKISSTMAHLFS